MIHVAVYDAQNLQVFRRAAHHKVGQESNGLAADRVPSNVNHTNCVHVLEPNQQHRQGFVSQAVVIQDKLRHEIVVELARLTERHTVLVPKVVVLQ